MNRLKSLTLPAVAFFAGAVTPFAFAPFGLWPLQIACLAILISAVLHTERARTAFYTGWAYGTASLIAGLYWLYVSMHTYGGRPSLRAGAAVVCLALFLGILAGLACLFTLFFMKGWQASLGITAILIFPAFWVLAEWVRGWIVTGLPWLVTGYAHTTSPLAGYAPVAGVYGVSFVAAIVAGAIALFFHIGREHWKTSLATVLAIIGLAFGAGSVLFHIDWTRPHGNPIQVRLLQGNVAQEFKFTPYQIGQALDMYAGMITSRPADLIVTPETAIPVYSHQLPAGYLEHLSRYAAQSLSHLALGMPQADTATVYTNSLIVMAPEDAGKPGLAGYRYNKHHLVPFGEFIPTGFRWFVRLMRIPLGDFTRGEPLQKPFRVKDQWILPNICYEDIFGEEIADQIRHEYKTGQPTPTVLLNVSNIAWFGNTIALPQHLQISQMRSLETGRPMLRATNTGTTAVIDARGRPVAWLPPYTRGELATTIQGTRGATPFIRFGNLTILIVALAALITARLLATRKRSR